MSINIKELFGVTTPSKWILLKISSFIDKLIGESCTDIGLTVSLLQTAFHGKIGEKFSQSKIQMKHLKHFDQSATRVILGNLHMYMYTTSIWLIGNSEARFCREIRLKSMSWHSSFYKIFFSDFFEGSSALFQTFRGSTFIFKYKNSKWKLSLACKA